MLALGRWEVGEVSGGGMEPRCVSADALRKIPRFLARSLLPGDNEVT